MVSRVHSAAERRGKELRSSVDLAATALLGLLQLEPKAPLLGNKPVLLLPRLPRQTAASSPLHKWRVSSMHLPRRQLPHSPHRSRVAGVVRSWATEVTHPHRLIPQSSPLVRGLNQTKPNRHPLPRRLSPVMHWPLRVRSKQHQFSRRKGVPPAFRRQGHRAVSVRRPMAPPTPATPRQVWM